MEGVKILCNNCGNMLFVEISPYGDAVKVICPRCGTTYVISSITRRRMSIEMFAPKDCWTQTHTMK